MNNRKKRR